MTDFNPGDRNYYEKSCIKRPVNGFQSLILVFLFFSSAFAAQASTPEINPSLLLRANISITSQGYICALGQANGYVVQRLKSRGVALSDYSGCNVLIYPPSKRISKKDFGIIEKSLRNGMQVVLDGYGDTPEEAMRIQKLSLAVVGAGFKADAVVITKSSQGHGRTAIPLFTKTTVERMVAANELKDEDMNNNTVDSYFGLAQKP